MINEFLYRLTTIKDGIGVIIAAIVTGITSLIGVTGHEIEVLLGFMAVDYITGLIVAGVFKKSNKSESGALESRAGLKGLFRKGGMLCIIYVAANLDILLGTKYIAIAAVYFFIANEGLSILENVGLMGMPYPPFLRNMIEVLKKEKSNVIREEK